MPLGIAIVILFASVGVARAQATAPANIIDRSPVPTVGTEGRLDVVLPYDDLEPAPANNKADVVLRVVERRPWGTGFRYDLRYVAAIPGDFELTKYLRRAGSEGPTTLPTIAASATGVLPAQHDGALEGVDKLRVDGRRWYWPVAIVVAVVWAGSMVPLILWGRRRKRAAAPVMSARVPTIAERLRPLVLAAARGELDADGQGRLERTLVHVWRQRLSLGDVAPTESLHRLREHADAGPLLVALEDWLHRPPSARRVDDAHINALLAPYATMPDEEAGAAR